MLPEEVNKDEKWDVFDGFSSHEALGGWSWWDPEGENEIIVG